MIESLKDFFSDNAQIMVIFVCFIALAALWAAGNNSRWLFGRKGARKGVRIVIGVMAGVVIAAGIVWLENYKY